MEFISNVITVDRYIDSIRSIQSPDPYVLPLRTKGAYPNWVRNIFLRKYNAKLYSSLKSKLLKTELCPPADPGLYFFFTRANGKPIFYYIGIADLIKRRLGEHLTRLDYIFYSMAHPHLADTYFKEVMQFYGEGLYPDHKDEYERQFVCYKSTSIRHIAWLSSPHLRYFEWDKLETFYVSIYKPCVNVDKKDATPDEQFRSLYSESHTYFLEHIFENVGKMAAPNKRKHDVHII